MQKQSSKIFLLYTGGSPSTPPVVRQDRAQADSNVAVLVWGPTAHGRDVWAADDGATKKKPFPRYQHEHVGVDYHRHGHGKVILVAAALIPGVFLQHEVDCGCIFFPVHDLKIKYNQRQKRKQKTNNVPTTRTGNSEPTNTGIRQARVSCKSQQSCP